MGPILKYCPEDFRVVENLVLPITSSSCNGGNLAYLKLLKCGYTTFEAVAAVSAYFGISSRDVQYAGLKDEDAITEQTIALPRNVVNLGCRGFNQKFAGSQYMRIVKYGVGHEAIEVGRLNGNGFRITVRNLERDTAERLFAMGKVSFSFVNFYDTQRFGVPNGPKTTHLIGGALLNGKYDEALDILKLSGSPESKFAVEYQGDPEMFFCLLDKRTTSFYKSAFSSYEWNAKLMSLLDKVVESSNAITPTMYFEGIPYRFFFHDQPVRSLFTKYPYLPYRKHYSSSPEGKRSTTISTEVAMTDLVQDQYHDGQFALNLSLFLPSGCYATMCIKQLVEYRGGS